MMKVINKLLMLFFHLQLCAGLECVRDAVNINSYAIKDKSEVRANMTNVPHNSRVPIVQGLVFSGMRYTVRNIFDAVIAALQTKDSIIVDAAVTHLCLYFENCSPERFVNFANHLRFIPVDQKKITCRHNFFIVQVPVLNSFLEALLERQKQINAVSALTSKIAIRKFDAGETRRIQAKLDARVEQTKVAQKVLIAKNALTALVALAQAQINAQVIDGQKPQDVVAQAKDAVNALVVMARDHVNARVLNVKAQEDLAVRVANSQAALNSLVAQACTRVNAAVVQAKAQEELTVRVQQLQMTLSALVVPMQAQALTNAKAVQAELQPGIPMTKEWFEIGVEQVQLDGDLAHISYDGSFVADMYVSGYAPNDVSESKSMAIILHCRDNLELRVLLCCMFCILHKSEAVMQEKAIKCLMFEVIVSRRLSEKLRTDKFFKDLKVSLLMKPQLTKDFVSWVITDVQIFKEIVFKSLYNNLSSTQAH